MPKAKKITQPDVEEIEEEEEEPKKPLGRQDMSEIDEKIKMNASIGYGFSAIELTGDNRWRVINKRRQWISPVLTKNEASQLAFKLNLADPEQKEINLPKSEKDKLAFKSDTGKAEGTPRVVNKAF